MTPAEKASLQFQAPNYRDPTSLVGHDVCCHCKRQTTVHGFTAKDGHWIETHHCPEHGDVAPMRSHILNR